MNALLIVAVTCGVALALGRTLIDLLLGRTVDGGRWMHASEYFVFALAIGLGVIAYGVFTLGMFGLLSPTYLVVWLGAATLLGTPGIWSICRECRASGMARGRDVQSSGKAGWATAITAGCACVLATLAVVAIAACFQPPGAHAWDALAYHLADPKIFLQNHRIVPLPTEHHSNFPFTVEMLFTLGLAFGGFAAANLFHLVMTVVLTVALVRFCARFLSGEAGWLSAVVLVTTPLVLWEASVAYIDLGLALYVFLAAYSVIFAIYGRGQSGCNPRPHEGQFGSRIMLVGAVMMGFALGIKYLALVPFVMLLTLAFLRRVPARDVAMFALAACAVGSPWYIKNVAWMRNPVYPFAFSVFRGSRYWSDSRARPYAEEQRSFGSPHELSDPIGSLRNLVTTPWKLLSSPEIYTNRADFNFNSLIGGLYVGLTASLVGIRRKPRVIWDLCLMLLFMFTAWFFVSQHVRYLIPVLPIGAILAGYAAEQWLFGARAGDGAESENGTRSAVVNSTKSVNALAATVVSMAIVGQVLVLGWGITCLPVAGRAAAQAHDAGIEPAALSAPEVFADLLSAADRDRHMRRLNSYGSVEWINQHAQAGAGVILYEDVHGFYLDRPYLWGNGEHSSYIPYEDISSGHVLTAWLHSHGIEYALFNLNNAPSNSRALLIPDDLDSTNAIMHQWYDGTGSGWRKLVGEAIQSGEWVVRFAHHGVAVLEIGTPGS